MKYVLHSDPRHRVHADGDARHHTWVAFALASLIAGVALLGGCGTGDGADGGNGEVAVRLGEWWIRTDPDVHAAGPVEFRVTNAGSILHEFVVVRTDIAGGEIPVGADAVFDEEAAGVEVIGEIPEWGAGSTERITLDLPAGDYQLVCNLPGHYRLGMWVAFTAE